AQLRGGGAEKSGAWHSAPARRAYADVWAGGRAMNKPSDVSHIDRHIGQRMRQARLAANCSLEAVACEVGISAPLIRYYERGSRRCYASRLYRIARFLGVSVSYFYEGLPDNK